jgi:dipeptidyl aminopeptidase/acylaminoacyl peptidase
MNRHCVYGLTLSVLLLRNVALAAEPSRAAQTLDQRLDAIFGVQTFAEVALSPNGRWLAWVEVVSGSHAKTALGSAIHLLDLQAAQGTPRRLTGGDGRNTHAEQGLAWSPDSRRLAFLSDQAKAGQRQLYVADPAANQVRKLTNVVGHLTNPRFAPDDKTLAILFTENSPRATGPTEAAAPEVGVIGEHVYEQRLSLVDTETGKLRPLSPVDLHVFEYDWSPDGRQFVAIAAEGDGNNNWYIARLLTLDVASGKVRPLFEPKMQIAVPRWSPDGQTIAFLGGLMSDEGVNGGDIYLISASGGKARNLTPKLPMSVSWLAWQPGGQGLLLAAHADGASVIGRVDAETGKMERLWAGDETIAGEGGAMCLSLSRDQQTTALIRHSFTQPPEVWSGPIGAWTPRTVRNRDQQPHWGKVEKRHWKSDEWRIQGWLVYPQHYDPKQCYPMVVSIHGGPASAKRSAWPGTEFDFTLLSGDDYFVFFPNPRGSYGQGENFTQANVKDFGHGDLRDILAGVDDIVRTLSVDEKRLGVVGWSYGGFMTMWTVTQTQRFRAAVAGAGIANWQSYYGQNGIDQWLIPYFGASVYDDPAVYARSSPMQFIKQVRTPTLVLVGEHDLECPPPQSMEFWRALKRLGVRTQLAVYEKEGHRITRPEHRRDILQRSARWLNEELNRPAEAQR